MILFGSVGPVKQMKRVSCVMHVSREVIMKDTMSPFIMPKLVDVAIVVIQMHGVRMDFVNIMDQQYYWHRRR
jgi:hypothetical protein